MSGSLNKFVLVVSAAFSLFTAAGAAQAGLLISDQRAWPQQAQSVGTGSSPYDAMARMGETAQTGGSFMYRGGPKTGTTSY